MTSMVNDLLEYSRTQLGGKMPFEPTVCDLGEVAQSALIDARLANPECDFVVTLANDLTGYFDSVRMQQVIMNLVANAAQYRTPGTTVTVALCGREDAVAISVHNLGIPIPPESLDTIFNAMVQLPSDEQITGRPSTSMGLGLFVAREIVLMHGGSIGVTSKLDAGTTFFISVPRVALKVHP